MIHHENDARIGLDAGQRFIVGVPQSDPVEELSGAPRQVVANPEIGISIERRHDLACIALDFPDQDFSWYVGFLRYGLDRFHHLGIIGQPIDQDLAFRLLERGNLQLQARVQLVDHAIDAPPDHPSRARNEQEIDHRPERERTGYHCNPYRKGDRFRHRRVKRAPGTQTTPLAGSCGVGVEVTAPQDLWAAR